MTEQKSDKDKREVVMKRPIYIVLDVDRVLINTEILYSTNFMEFVSYPEDEGALDKLKNMGIICVFSEVTVHGTLELQKKKLERLGINQHVIPENVHISPNKIESIPAVLDKYGHGFVVLVDDRLEVLEEALRVAEEKKMASQIITFWVQRGPHAEKAIQDKRPLGQSIPVLNLNGVVAKAPMVIQERLLVSV